MDLPTTNWTMLARATLHGDSSAGEALEQFCRQYRTPVLQLLRRRGLPENRIEDMAQDFFLQLMRASSLKKADPAQGRFRQFLCGALSNFLADNADYHLAQKRGGRVPHCSLDAGEALGVQLAAPDGDNSTLLDLDWALLMVGRALETVAGAWEAAGKGDRFNVLRAFLPGARETLSQEVAAARLQLSDTAFRTALHRLREEFRHCLRCEVAATVAGPHEVDEELRHLREVLAAAGGRPAL